MRSLIAALVLTFALAGMAQANSTIGHTIGASCVNAPDAVLVGESFTSTATGVKPGTWRIYLFNYDTQTEYGPVAEVQISGGKTGAATLSTEIVGQLSTRWYLNGVAGPRCVVTVTTQG